MKAMHDDLVFTLSCGGKAYEMLLAEGTKLGLIDATKKLAVGCCAGGGFVLKQARAGQFDNAFTTRIHRSIAPFCFSNFIIAADSAYSRGVLPALSRGITLAPSLIRISAARILSYFAAT
jgi:hypothetical protein